MSSAFWSIKKKTEYRYKGTKNKTIAPFFVKLCKMSQPVLRAFVYEKLIEAGYKTILADGYVYAKGDIPILLTAHLDTVHKETVKDFYEYKDELGNHILSSPQGIGGDDRCGVWMILNIISKGYRPSILFCEDEEIGGIGSDKFCKSKYIDDLKEMKFLVELDRAHDSDAVFYDTNNSKFVDFIKEEIGYKKETGSFSDISNLSPECDIASVNLSCGYYHAHTLQEEVNIEEMTHTMNCVCKLLNNADKYEKYEFDDGTPRPRNYYGYGYGYGKYSSWYDYENDLLGYGNSEEHYMEIVFINPATNEEETELYSGEDEYQIMVQFFKEHPTICYNDIVNEWFI